MATRTINVSLLMQRPGRSRIEFTPDLTSVDGDVLLKKVYVFTTDAAGDATITLPVKASGTIRYTYKLPTDQARYPSTGEFYLEAGSAIDLDDLITAGVVATDSVEEYVDAAITALQAKAIPTTLTDGATITWTFTGNESRNAKVTLGGNRTLALSGCTPGASGTLVVIQGAGGQTLALPSGSYVVNGGAGVATLSTGAADRDVLSFLYISSTEIYWTVGLDFTAA